MSPTLLGELAALMASVCFTFGPTLFTLAGREIGSVKANRMRLLLGALYFGILHMLLYGRLFPRASWAPIVYMLLSGVIGLALSDTMLFEAFVRVGPRIALLILNLTPALAAATAWVVLDERLTLSQTAAIAVVLAGVSWVVLERETPDEDGQTSALHDRAGLLFAFAAALVSTASVILAKLGLRAGLSPISGATLRMFGGMLTLWTWTLLTKAAAPTLRTMRCHPKALGIIAAAVLIGPVLGMSLSMFALKAIPVGIATTLASLPPILLLPVGRWFFKEHITPRAVLGTVIATAGVIWLLV